MMQRPTYPKSVSTDVDHHVVLFPTRSTAQVQAECPADAANRPVAGPLVGVRTHVIREVVVLEVAGRFKDVVHELDRAIQFALAAGVRGVVCDLTAVVDGAEPGAVAVLATSGRHVRDWSGVPVAVACPCPLVREGLAAQPLGGHLILATSMFSALTTVLATPTVAVERLRLMPHPVAPRASREFVTRTLLDWGLGQLILSSTLVVGELVTNAMMHALPGTDIGLSVAWNLGALRLTVQDSSPELPRHPYTQFGLHGRGLSAIAGLSRASGVLPSTDGGKVVWAVLNAAKPRPRTS